MPESAWAAITYGTTSHGEGASASISSATSCTESPMTSVAFSPRRAASQPPTRFVMTPKSS